MEKPKVIAKVKYLNKPNWIELYAGGVYIGEVYGEATLKPKVCDKYMLVLNNTLGFFHIDEVERIDEVIPAPEDLLRAEQEAKL